MKHYGAKRTIGSVLTALIYIGLGLFLFIQAKAAGNIICYALGVMLLTLGIIEIILGFYRKSQALFYQFDLIIGVILIGVGIMIVINPPLFQRLLSWIIGGLLLISAVSDLLYGIDMKGFAYKNWWVAVIFSLIKIIGAIILFTHTVGEVLFRIAGVLLVIGGVTDIITLIMLALIRKKGGLPASVPREGEEAKESFVDAKEGTDYRDA